MGGFFFFFFFLAILRMGPMAFLIGKISDVKPDFGKFFRTFRVDDIFQVDIIAYGLFI